MLKSHGKNFAFFDLNLGGRRGEKWNFRSPACLLASRHNPNTRPTMKTGIADDVSAATDRSEIERLAAGFTDSWNSHDMAQFARLFADDADFVNVVGM